MSNKIGTFFCVLFGHKFVGEFREGNRVNLRSITFCVRCGIPIESVLAKAAPIKSKEKS